MKNFLVSQKININHEQDISEIKDFLKETLSQVIEIDEIGAGNDHFYIKGSTGGIFDFVRKAKVYADIEFILDETKTSRELRVFAKGHTVISYSMMITYLVLFCTILLAGLLPGSIESSEKGTALDALVFLIIGYYIKTEIDKSLLDAETHFTKTIKMLETRFSI